MAKHWVVLWYGLSSFLLGLLLFFPVRKLILALSANRQARRLQRDLTEEELQGLKRRASKISAVLSMTFAFLYNRVLMAKYFVQ
jgi:hypothetical protein